MADHATELLPLSEPVFQIILALSDRSLHGYAIMQDVRTRTAGRVDLGPGTLYGAIRRLRDLELIREVEDDDASDPRRRHYELTPFGREVGRMEAARLQSMLDAAHAKRLLPATEET